MIRFSILYLFFVFCFVGCYSNESVIYVSSTQGEDSNDGSQSYPLKSINAAINRKPTKILLNRGDIFYENVILDGIDIDCYGLGDLPVISGKKIVCNNDWEKGEIKDSTWIKSKNGNIWRINLKSSNSKNKGFVTDPNIPELNNIGQIINADVDTMYNCKRVKYLNELSEDFDFWIGDANNQNLDGKCDKFDYLYLYNHENIKEKSIGLAVYLTGLKAKNCKVKHLKVKNWGRCGIVLRSNITVQNCIVEEIGGSLFLTFHKWISYGNGIECGAFDNTLTNCIVENCIVRKCYDCGITIQGKSDKYTIYAKDCEIRNNLIMNCCQSFEFYLRGKDDKAVFNNCIVSNNVSISPGMNTGFRYYIPRYYRSHILENSNRKTNITYAYNTFINGNYYCASPIDNRQYNEPDWKYNKCFIKRGQDLMGDYNGKYDVIKVPNQVNNTQLNDKDTDEAISEYRSKTKDFGTEFIIIDDEMIENYIKEFLHQLSILQSYSK